MSAAARPAASVSLDADDLWAYLRTHGDPAWERRPSYLPLFYPRALDLFDELGVRITFFVVGSDAARPENGPALADVAARGHEVGNHSYDHEVWLADYDEARLDDELARAEQAIEGATGVRTVGFRGPGYAWSRTVLRVLARRGYQYDASTLPTYLAPLARLYFMASTNLPPEERARRHALFGSWRDGLRPVSPYWWQLDNGQRLLELPVTTMPGVKAPFHMSYLLYLARYSTGLMDAYLAAAIAACRVAGVAPSFLLHPLDLLGPDEAPGLQFFPGMQLPVARKLTLVRRAITALAAHYELGPMLAHARHAASAPRGLATRVPDRPSPTATTVGAHSAAPRPHPVDVPPLPAGEASP